MRDTIGAARTSDGAQERDARVMSRNEMSDFADPLSSVASVGTDEPPKRDVSRAKVLSRRLSGVPAATATTAMTGALFLLLFVPPLVMAVAGVWAAVTGL